METKALAARIEIMSFALQEMARALPAEQSAAVAEKLRMRATALVASSNSGAVDNAIASELVAIFEALGS